MVLNFINKPCLLEIIRFSEVVLSKVRSQSRMKVRLYHIHIQRAAFLVVDVVLKKN